MGPKTFAYNDDAGLMKCNVEGCGDNPTALTSGRVPASGLSGPHVVVTGGVVYVNDADSSLNSGIYGCASSGCSNAPTAFANGGADAIASDGNSVYWATFSAHLYACPVTPGNAQELTLWDAGNTPCVASIAVDSENVFAFAQAPTSIIKCSTTGCAAGPTSLVSWDAFPDTTLLTTEIAVDAINVYFATGSKIVRCAKSGCANSPTVITTGVNGVTDIATDGIYVYWTETGALWDNGQRVAGAGSVGYCPVTGCSHRHARIRFGYAEFDLRRRCQCLLYRAGSRR